MIYLSADFEVIKYTVYNHIVGGTVSAPIYATRDAVVIREKTTGYTLVPHINEQNKLQFYGQWEPQASDSAYAKVRAEVSVFHTHKYTHPLAYATAYMKWLIYVCYTKV